MEIKCLTSIYTSITICTMLKIKGDANIKIIHQILASQKPKSKQQQHWKFSTVLNRKRMSEHFLNAFLKEIER